MKTVRLIAPAAAMLGVLGVLVVVGLLAACGSQTVGTSGSDPTPTPHSAGIDEIEIVRYALITDVTNIKTSHRVVTMTTTTSGRTGGTPGQQDSNGLTRFEADFQAPDTMYVWGTLNGKEFERWLIANKFHRKDAGGKWEQYTESDDAFMALFFAMNMPYEFLQASLSYALESQTTENPVQIKVGGEELLNGISTRLFAWEISGGTGSSLVQVWVDPTAKRAYKLVQCSSQVAPNTATPSICWSVVISKVNEPIPPLP